MAMLILGVVVAIASMAAFWLWTKKLIENQLNQESVWNNVFLRCICAFLLAVYVAVWIGGDATRLLAEKIIRLLVEKIIT